MYSAIPKNGDTSNALMSRSPAQKCVFKSRLKRSDSTAGSRNESGSEFQTVGPDDCMCCDKTAEYSVCDGWPNGGVAAANFGDWHVVVGNIPGNSLIQHTRWSKKSAAHTEYE